MKKIWLIAGAVMGCLAGASLGACGSSGGSTGGGSTGGGTAGGGTTSTTTTTSTTSTTTSTTTTTTTTSSNTGGGGMGGGGTGGGAVDGGTSDGGICSKPATLHPPSPDAGADTLFCPFSGADGGKDESCDPASQHCCEPASGTASCQPSATACATGDTDWKCEDPVADCPSGQECCAAGASIGLSTDPACGNFAHKLHGTACVAAGTCNGIQMCTSDSECPSGKTCIAFRTKGNQVGGCN